MVTRFDCSSPACNEPVPPASADGGLETTVLNMLKFDRALYGETLYRVMKAEKITDAAGVEAVIERAGADATASLLKCRARCGFACESGPGDDLVGLQQKTPTAPRS